DGTMVRPQGLTTPHRNNRHLQTGEGFMHIQMQILTQQCSGSKTASWLVRSSIDILYQFISNQTRIMVALFIIETANGLTRCQKIVDKLSHNWQRQKPLYHSVKNGRVRFLQDGRRGRDQYKTLEQLRSTIGCGDDIRTGSTLSHYNRRSTHNLL